MKTEQSDAMQRIREAFDGKTFPQIFCKVLRATNTTRTCEILAFFPSGSEIRSMDLTYNYAKAMGYRLNVEKFTVSIPRDGRNAEQRASAEISEIVGKKIVGERL